VLLLSAKEPNRGSVAERDSKAGPTLGSLGSWRRLALHRSLWGRTEACGVPQKLAVAVHKLAAGHRSLRRQFASFRRATEACGGSSQACGGPQKLVVAVRKLAAGHRSLRWRSTSLRRATEACGGGPQASGGSQKLAVAVHKLLAGHGSLRWRSPSFWLSTETAPRPVSTGGATRRLPVDGAFPTPRSFQLVGLVLRMTAWRLLLLHQIACGKFRTSISPRRVRSPRDGRTENRR